ncbi:DNA-dependent RNA polymerase subunit rpo19 [Alphaentomopoxvirus acuprea]|uniref:DNA-dependent RNA polymerase subunit rpo19 n=1 Tax=Alphaentomopoxvirus acuprea TaxID=62099 RepID=W6JKY9_9POXV|nr:DNA-dependent RNA polymerase subunit rpo19 [Anomala cuprea entomopoxvirus]BAO49460.1 DNA-dependent RNA polymerase subunit rpo19 [Anomala cuprea entomopoxvirus]
MSDYEEEETQLELTDEENEEDILYDESCTTDNDEDKNAIELIDSYITVIEEPEKVTKIKKKNNIFMNNKIDISNLKMAKDEYLYIIKLNEMLNIVINYNNLLKRGSDPFISEELLKLNYNIELFNNDGVTPETITFICLILMNIPICIKKYNKLYNRDIDNIINLSENYIRSYYGHIKTLLRSIMYNNNNNFNFAILKKIFPVFIEKLNSDIITIDELNEIVSVKNKLQNNKVIS